MWRRRSTARGFWLLASAILVAGVCTASAETFSRPKTYVDLKFAHVVRQQWDFTCGAASLATVLKFHYGMPVSERMIFSMIASRYRPEELKQKAQQGLSFEDLIYVADKLGFQSQAATVPIEELEKLTAPVIVQLDLREVDHFVVLRKKTPERAYLADPYFGEITLENPEFAQKFKGPVLAIWPSYATAEDRSGLSVIRDPMSAERSLAGSLRTPFSNWVKPR